MGILIVMTIHNYRLICPNGFFFTQGKICEKCSGGHEYWCVLKNCENNLLKSFGYALRNYIARKRSYFLNNVNKYLCLTQFQKQHLINEGFSEDKLVVLPHMIEPKKSRVSYETGKYVGYAGRISPEKGIKTFIEAAEICNDIQFKAAGSYKMANDILAQNPKNLKLCGHLKDKQLEEFYSNSRIIVLCSIWYEAFGLVLLEAMIHGKAIVCSRLGGLTEIVDDGITGLLFEPGNAQDLSEKIRYLWDRPDLCKKMGEAGREKALELYSPEKYYNSLMTVYKNAIRVKSEDHL